MDQAYLDIIKATGEDPDRPGLVDTPKRAAQAMMFLTQGYKMDIDEVINDAMFPSDTDEIIIVKNIELYSMCEHHMLPFFGKAHVAYIPNGHIVGLSKIPRIVDVYARRLQVQERLTEQIRATIQYVAQTDDVAVYVDAKHWCVKSRGIQDQTSSTVTLSVGGVFADKVSEIRKEFLNLARSG